MQEKQSNVFIVNCEFQHWRRKIWKTSFLWSASNIDLQLLVNSNTGAAAVVIERRLLHFWVLWEATHLWINNLKCFTSKWDGYWSFLMSGELFKCRQTAIRMQNFEIQNKKITPPIAQQNWGFLGWKRQFSSDAGSSAIPGKLSSRNFVKQNLAVQLAVVFLRFRKKHKKLILRLDFTPNLYHKNHF